MHTIKEIRFINYDEFRDSRIVNEEEAAETKDAQEARWARVFGKVEEILDSFGILPEVATITRDGLQMVVSLETEFTLEKAIAVLSKLEEIFEVTTFDYETEADEWCEIQPHVSYGFYEFE